jgi:hypothetical protein
LTWFKLVLNFIHRHSNTAQSMTAKESEMQAIISTPAAHDVDTLGQLLAQIADLTKQADSIKDAIKDSASAGGDKVVEGDLFKATYIESNRSVVDHKALYAALGITAEQVAQYTKTTAVFSVKVTSK